MRLHPVATDRYVITPNRRALTRDQWLQLGQDSSQRLPLTPETAAMLYDIFAAQTSRIVSKLQRRSYAARWRTDEWDDTTYNRRQLRQQQLLDETGVHVRAHPDVYYSLGLSDSLD